MTCLEIDKAMTDIAREKCALCKARLDAVPKDKATERKAVQLEYGIYTFCGNAGLLFNSSGAREKTITVRRRFLDSTLHKYPKANNTYQTLDQEEKMRFAAALQAEAYIRDQWLGAQYAELSAAEASDDTKKIFELKIKIGSALSMFDAWEAWRRKNGVYPDMFTEEE